MVDYAALIVEWATLSGTTAQKLTSINALTVAGPNQDVPAASVVGYLAMQAKLAAFQAYAATPPDGASSIAVMSAKELFAILAMPSFSTFETSVPAVLSALSAWLNACASDQNTGLTSSDVTNMLSLAATTQPWWRANGYTSPISSGDLAAAGGLS